MASKYTNLASSSSEYGRFLPGADSGFRGVDFSSSPSLVAPYRFAWLENMYRDYHTEQGGAIETIPGYRMLKDLGAKIYGLFAYEDADGVDWLMVHAGNALWRAKDTERDNPGAFERLGGELAENKSRAFSYYGKFYILDGEKFRVLTGEGLLPVMDKAYVPLTHALGEEYEQRNMLTDLYRVRDLGSSGVATPYSHENDYKDYDFGQKDGARKYVGKNSFLVPPGSHNFMNLSQYTNTAVRALVLRLHDEESGISGGSQNIKAATETDTGLKTIFLSSETGTEEKPATLTIERGAFAKFEGIERIYFGTLSEHGKINFEPGDDGEYANAFDTVMPKTVYFPCAIMKIREYFADVDAALQSLPPNLVLEKGKERDTGIIFTTGGSVIAPAHETQQIDVVPALPDDDEIDETKIYIYSKQADGSENKTIHVRYGKGVSGRHYILGSLEDEYGRYQFPICFCIDEQNEEGTVAESRFVFDYDAVPMTFTAMHETNELLSATDGDFDAGCGVIYEGDNVAQFGVIARNGENVIDFTARATDYKFDTIKGHASYQGANPDYGGTSEDAINRCTMCALYDDRIFLAGNPHLPNTVFYSARNDTGVTDPTYFGVLNYFNDGTGFDRITALFAAGGFLAVAKKGTIFYHQGADGDDIMPRIYPSVQGNAGIGAVSADACCNFLDDPIFLTPRGVMGISKETLTLERTLGMRSDTINTKLLEEKDLSAAEMAEWDGYLVLMVNGNVYLADSRAMYTDATGGVQYEWFYLTDLADGSGDKYYHTVTGNVYVESELVPEGSEIVGDELYPLSFATEEIRVGADLVKSGTLLEESVSYTEINGHYYLVEESEEREHADQKTLGAHPLVVGEHFYFAAGNKVFIFNNDKRGLAVEFNGFTEEVAHDVIHRKWYSFDGRAIRSMCSTALDDCGVPHLAKTTAKRSLVLRAKVMDDSLFTVSVLTDRVPEWREIETATTGGENFLSTDYANKGYTAARDIILVGHEKEKRWVEKQFAFADGGYCRPFGLYNVAYRYSIAGRIKG